VAFSVKNDVDVDAFEFVKITHRRQVSVRNFDKFKRIDISFDRKTGVCFFLDTMSTLMAKMTN